MRKIRKQPGGAEDYPRVRTIEVGEGTFERCLHHTNCPEMEDVLLTFVGTSEASPDGSFRFARPWPPNAQLLMTVSGIGEVMVDGRWTALEPGQVYLTPVRVAHAYRSIVGKQWKVAWAQYRKYAVTFPKPVIRSAAGSRFVEAIEGLLQEHEGVGQGAAKQCWVRLIDIECQRLLGTPAKDEQIAAVWSTVSENLSHSWTLADLAQLAHLSQEQFRRRCQTALSAAPMRHLSRLRMHLAADLLVSTDMTVDEIAHRVGYDNVFALSVAFKREMGVSPSAFRK